MSNIKTELAGKLKAEGEDGNQYTIEEYVTLYKSNEVGSDNLWTAGASNFLLSDGSALSRLSETEFLIMRSGVKLTVKE